MRLLGVDFETTGLDPKEARIVEMGAVLWDTELRGPISMLGFLVNPVDFGPRGMEPEAEKVHGLSGDLVRANGHHAERALQELGAIAATADYIVAFNGNHFDRPLWAAEAHRWNCDDAAIRKVWIDVMADVPYPEGTTCRKLRHLASDHGLLNPYAHRAMFDVMTMLQLLDKYASQWDLILRNALAPTLKIRAVTAFEGRDLAKARRYRWDPEKKIWWKEIKDFDLAKEKAEAPFHVVVLETSTAQAGGAVAVGALDEKPPVGSPNVAP